MTEVQKAYDMLDRALCFFPVVAPSHASPSERKHERDLKVRLLLAMRALNRADVGRRTITGATLRVRSRKN